MSNYHIDQLGRVVQEMPMSGPRLDDAFANSPCTYPLIQCKGCLYSEHKSDTDNTENCRAKEIPLGGACARDEIIYVLVETTP
jgi:hypothetical protein